MHITGANPQVYAELTEVGDITSNNPSIRGGDCTGDKTPDLVTVMTTGNHLIVVIQTHIIFKGNKFIFPLNKIKYHIEANAIDDHNLGERARKRVCLSLPRTIQRDKLAESNNL